MKNFKKNFIKLYGSLFDTKLWVDMKKTVEDTKWHREANVAIHTDMVMKTYHQTYPNEWSGNIVLGAFACAFHDVGKPSCEQLKHSEERGDYRSYPGHEQRSARMWEDWAMTNSDVLARDFDFTVHDVYKVGWLIQHHLPYSIKHVRKISYLKATSVSLFGDVELYCSALRSDSRGRTSDDWENNQLKSDEWYDMLRGFEVKNNSKTELSDDAPECIIMIGASGSGKSTYVNEHYADYDLYSWDAYRLRDYTTAEEKESDTDPVELYRLAHDRASEDSLFIDSMRLEFIDYVNSGRNIVVDNLNLSAKRRFWFIDQARSKGYRVIAVIMPISQRTLEQNSINRTDHKIGFSAIRNMYNIMSYPSFHEFDDVRVSSYWWNAKAL